MRKDIKKEEKGETSDDGCVLLIILALILWSCVQTCTHTEEILEIEHRIENNIINKQWINNKHILDISDTYLK